jgi:hypothetical protein
MKRSDIEWVVGRLLPDGWYVEGTEVQESDCLDVIVRQGRGRARRISIPGRVMLKASMEAGQIIDDAIDKALGLGRYATTPIVPVNPAWSPYP